jgi:osmotically-inducible protein OsmY
MTHNILSDESIKSSVTHFLSEYPYVDASDVQVTVESGFVNLNGTVRDKQQQKTAEEVVKTLPGVKDVFNYITIDAKNGLIGNANNDLNMI